MKVITFSMSTVGNAFGDADGQRDPRVGRLHDRVGRKRRRHEDDRRIRAGLAHASCTLLKIGQPSCVVPPLPGVTPPTTVRAVRRGRLGVERALAAGEPLHDEPRVVGRAELPWLLRPLPFGAAERTTLSAASPIESAVAKFRPLSFSIRLPSSTLVPSMRMTIGTGTPSSVTAAMTPCASTSQRRMPPKMLISTALTFLSAIRIWNAF